MDWFLYALSASLVFSVYSLVIRVLLKGKGEPQVFTILSNFFIGVTLFVIAIFTEFFSNLALFDYFLILISSFLFAIASSFFITGRQQEEVGVVSIIRETSVVWIFLIGITVFNEQTSFLKIIGMILILVGTIYALWQKDIKHISRGMIIVFIATLAMSAGSSISKDIVETKLSPAVFNMVVFFLASFWIFLFTQNRRERIKHQLKLFTWKIPAVSALMALSVFLLNKGFQTGPISYVFPIYSSYVIFTVLAGIIFLGEKTHAKRKIIGSIVAFIGVILLRLIS